MMNVPLSLNHLLERAGTLFAQNRSSRACPTSRCARTPTASTTGARAARRGAAVARPEEGRARRDALLEPPRAPRVLLRHPGRGRRDAHAEPAPGARRDRLDRARRRGPLPDRRRRPAAALPPVRRQARVRAGDRVPVLGRAGRTRTGHLDYEALLAGADGEASCTPRTTRTTRSPCATRRARPGGRRASSIRTARPCCTRWSAASARTGRLKRTDCSCRSRRCSMPTAGACRTAR